MKKPKNINGEATVKLSLQLIKERYCEYNDLYFEGKLPKCSVCWLSPKVGNSGLMLGDRHHRAILFVSARRKWTETELKGLILHEMLHLVCALKYGFNWSHHMWPYAYERYKFKKKFGFKIPFGF